MIVDLGPVDIDLSLSDHVLTLADDSFCFFEGHCDLIPCVFSVALTTQLSWFQLTKALMDEQ